MNQGKINIKEIEDLLNKLSLNDNQQNNSLSVSQRIIDHIFKDYLDLSIDKPHLLYQIYTRDFLEKIELLKFILSNMKKNDGNLANDNQYIQLEDCVDQLMLLHWLIECNDHEHVEARKKLSEYLTRSNRTIKFLNNLNLDNEELNNYIRNRNSQVDIKIKHFYKSSRLSKAYLLLCDITKRNKENILVGVGKRNRLFVKNDECDLKSIIHSYGSNINYSYEILVGDYKVVNLCVEKGDDFFDGELFDYVCHGYIRIVKKSNFNITLC